MLRNTIRTFIKQTKNLYYGRRRGFFNGSQTVPFVTPEVGNGMLLDAVNKGGPLMVARHGSTELQYVTSGTQPRFDALCGISGFFPRELELGRTFIQKYREACRDIDFLAVWNYRRGRFREEELIFRETSPQARLVDLKSLNAFCYSTPWSSALAGKKVLVVHPFARTIFRQYHTQREHLFQKRNVLPEFQELILVPAVQSMGGGAEGFSTWFDALKSLEEKIQIQDFDIALIGCGAYGLPLASFVKRMGKQAIHLGGVLQLFFGIKGKRWEAPGYNYHLEYYNEHWTRPGEDETPANKEKFEGGCYW